MKKYLNKDAILQLVNDGYPESFVLKQAAETHKTEKPMKLLAQYIVASVDDLYGDTSNCEANLERIAVSLDVGSQILHHIVLRLRRQQPHYKIRS